MFSTFAGNTELPITHYRRSVKAKPLRNALAAGLALSQLLATVFVYRSNTALAQKVADLHREGYLVVPGLLTVPPLESLSAAFWGGVFYTLSIGAALTLLGFAATWLYVRLSKHRRLLAAAIVPVWSGLLYAVNSKGFEPVVSLYFVLVPACVFAASVGSLRQAPQAGRKGVWMIPLLAAATLAVVWTTQLNDRLFLNIRDYFLLSNPIGARITDFYYRYTLFAAEPFKSLDQKTLHTCRVSGLKDSTLRNRVEQRLRSYDYLPVKNPETVELSLFAADGEFVFSDNGREILWAEPSVFFSATDELLALFSEKTDRYAFLRGFTFYAILLAFPLLLFTAAYGLVYYLTGILLRPDPAKLISAAVCLLLGTAPLLPLQLAGARSPAPQNVDLDAALNSGHWRQQVAALRRIEQHGLEIADFNSYPNLLNASRVPVRYWSARALSVSRRSETIDDLLRLLDDPQPTVVCQALYALGQRRNRSATAAVAITLKRSTSWYVQHYAYRALRSLGWKQPALS